MNEVKWVKVRVLDGIGAVSHQGVTYVAHDGLTDVPEDVVEALVKTLGCKVHEPAEAKPATD